MRVAYLLGAAALQLGAAVSLKLELNRELSVSFAHKGIAFSASRAEVPIDLLMDVSASAGGGNGNGNNGNGNGNSGTTSSTTTGTTVSTGNNANGNGNGNGNGNASGTTATATGGTGTTGTTSTTGTTGTTGGTGTTSTTSNNGASGTAGTLGTAGTTSTGTSSTITSDNKGNGNGNGNGNSGTTTSTGTTTTGNNGNGNGNGNGASGTTTTTTGGGSTVDSDPVSATFEQRSCVIDDSSYSSSTVHIHVLISSSLTSDECGKIAQWSANLYDTAATSSYKDMMLSFVIVKSSSYGTDDDEDEDAGTAYGANNLLATSDDDPYALLRSIGTVYETLDDPELTQLSCEAVFSFVDDDTSLQTVLSYEDGRRVDSAINFRVCSSGSCCTEQSDYCTAIHRVDDAFLYNPMTITREMSCAGVLTNGVPVIYVDSYGSRSCYCACPAGYEEDATNGCVEVNPPPCKCEWNKRSGYRKEICSLPTPSAYGEPSDVCTFSNVATAWKVPVPFPTDGYVADARENGDVDKGNPRVEVTVTKQHNPVYYYDAVIAAVNDGKLPYQAPETYPALTAYRDSASSTSESDKNYTWHYYHTNRDDVIDSLAFHGYGKYQLELDAYDYYGSASCPGCISIVDSIRPRATHTCPAGLGDEQPETSTGSGSKCANSAALTKENLIEVNNNIDDYFEFSEDVYNDKCSEISDRCDVESFKVRKFYDDDYCDESESYKSAGEECFDEKIVLQDYLTNPKSKANPLTNADGTCHGEDVPVTPNQCTRCCDYHTEIREWWIDYKCGYDYDTKRCSGTGSDHEKCAHHQCMVLDGEHVATGSVSIRDEIQKATEEVLASLGNSAYGFNSIVEIHDSLECSNYGETESGRCTYEKKLTELFDASLIFNAEFDWGSYADVKDYVFWRYTIPNKKEGWKAWNPFPGKYETEETIVFSRPKTTITVEAWTQCGRVLTFTASVHLHLHSVVSVCDHYDKMWYQTTTATKFDNSTICAYPGSDFAEITFDFHSSTGLENTPERAGLSLSQVECYGEVNGQSSVQLFSVPGGDIVSRFGVEMVYKTQTQASTDFKVDCTFTYSGPNGYSTLSTCSKTVLIQDCKAPCFDTHADHCQYTECAGSAQPGLYEACGGAIVSIDGYSTTLTTESKECCQGCASDDMEVSCVPLLNLPDASQDLMRCQPFPKSSTGYGDSTTHGYNGGHRDTDEDEDSETDLGEGVVYASPYSDTETTSDTNTGAYEFLANTFPIFRSGGLFGRQSTNSNTAYGDTQGTTATTSGGAYGGQASTGASTTTTGAYDSQSTTTTTGDYGTASGGVKSSSGGLISKVSGIVNGALGTAASTVSNVKDDVKDKLQNVGSAYNNNGGNNAGNYSGNSNAVSNNNGNYGGDSTTNAAYGYSDTPTSYGNGDDNTDNNGGDRDSDDGYANGNRGRSGGHRHRGKHADSDDADTTTSDTYSSTTATSNDTSQVYGTSATTPTTSAYSMLAAASSAAQEHPEVMALLGSSAFVAVVALVVVKRRAEAIRLERMENDVYYPLLH